MLRVRQQHLNSQDKITKTYLEHHCWNLSVDSGKTAQYCTVIRLLSQCKLREQINIVVRSI